MTRKSIAGSRIQADQGGLLWVIIEGNIRLLKWTSRGVVLGR